MRKFLQILVMMFPAVVGGANDQHQQPEHLSLIQLISNPEKYDGKRVSVVGFLYFGGVDGDGLYLHKEDCDNAIGSNGLMVDRTKQMFQERERLYDNYVLIVGVFRREEIPPLHFSPGRITGIERCELWSQPDHPISQRLKELRGQEPQKRQ